MTETVISVQGTFSAQYPPERAKVLLEVNFEAPDRDSAFAAATDAAAAIRDALTALHDAATGPVTTWSSDTLRVWSSRPWNDQGVQLPLVHHAAVSVRATFSNFAELSSFSSWPPPAKGCRSTASAGSSPRPAATPCSRRCDPGR